MCWKQARVFCRKALLGYEGEVYVEASCIVQHRHQVYFLLAVKNIS